MANLPIAVCGVRGAGRSTFLASMAWRLPQVLSKHFGLSFEHADPLLNRTLLEAEQQLFRMRTDELRLAETKAGGHALEKTASHAGEPPRVVSPFLFALDPLSDSGQSASRSRLVSLYSIDAIESASPNGPDSSVRALANSRALLFLFDPTQHVRFRRAAGLEATSQQASLVGSSPDQASVLSEIAWRIRHVRSEPAQQRLRQPLVVVLTKFDLWARLLGWDRLQSEWILNSLNIGFLDRTSQQLRNLLLQFAPDIVATAESAAAQVHYVPVSALGDVSTTRRSVPDPMWVEVPLLLAMHLVAPGLIPASRQSPPAEALEAVKPKSSSHTVDTEVTARGGQENEDSRAAPPDLVPRIAESPVQKLEHVEFTVYHPRRILPERWHSLLAFTHLGELPPDASPERPDPVAEVQRRAEQVLGRQLGNYRPKTNAGQQPIPRQEVLTFVPHGDRLEFNPPSQSFLWIEDVHQTEFRMRARQSQDGEQLPGGVSVYIGAILLADIGFTVRLAGSGEDQAVTLPKQQVSARPYRRIFASYSHQDLWVVEQFEKYAAALGDRYLRDWTELRAGEEWSPRLMEMIDEADVFQLFWSSASSRSRFVEQEWRYALSQSKTSFIRPGYWEDPFPNPPSELQSLHFQRLPIDLGPSRGNVGNEPARPSQVPTTGPSGDRGRESETRLPPIPPIEDRATHRAPSIGQSPDIFGDTTSASAVAVGMQTLLASPESFPDSELAELNQRLTVAVLAVNGRLTKCDTLLRQGLRFEALQECELEPPLLEVVAILDSLPRDEWDSLVTPLGLTSAPPLRIDLAAELNDAYAGAAPLRSLMQRHRELAVAQAPIRLRLDVLRRIVELDPSNPAFREDLRALEAARLREIEFELQRAPLELVRDLEHELQSSAWQHPPTALLRHASRTLKQLQRVQARKALESLVGELNASFLDFDVPRGRELRDHWRRAAAAAEIPDDDALCDSVAPVFQWLDEQDRQEFEETQYRRAVDELAHALDAGSDRSELERRHGAAMSFGRGLPEVLSARVRDRIAQLEHVAQRRMSFQFAAALIVTLGLAIAAYLMFVAR